MEPIRRVSCSDRVALARETNRVLGEALAAHPGRYVALAVGDSTLPVYYRLDELGAAWAGRTIMPVDELVPPPEDPSLRFAARLSEALPETLRSRLAPIDVSDDPHLRAVELEARLRVEGLAAVVLGLGPDGHFAFNQPVCPSEAATRVVDLTPGNHARLAGVDRCPSALTLGVTTILAAGSVLVIAAGAGKAEALDHLLNGPEEPAWPITWLRRHPRLTVAINGDLS
ncbi:MAG TPA: 6-phosphogluconolactonase [Acidimicrobiia bacterium]|nr:6-phosphogluconolactonase [Acidimicrobiia bacterium]